MTKLIDLKTLEGREVFFPKYAGMIVPKGLTPNKLYKVITGGTSNILCDIIDDEGDRITIILQGTAGCAHLNFRTPGTNFKWLVKGGRYANP